MRGVGGLLQQHRRAARAWPMEGVEGVWRGADWCQLLRTPMVGKAGEPLP